MSIVTKAKNPELYNSLFEDSTIEDAKKVMQNMFNDITPEQFEELKKQAIENVKQNNMSDEEKLKSISKRIRKAIDNNEDDLLYVLFDIQDIIQDEEEQKLAYDRYIKPYIE